MKNWWREGRRRFFRAMTGPLSGCTLPARTFGGKQFWSDVLIRRGWRIQKNRCLGYCRVLDGEDRRRFQGSYRDCRSHLESRFPVPSPTDPPRSCVVLVHGLLRSRDSLRPIENRLTGEGYEVLNLNYPSGWGSIPSHARQVTGLLARLASPRRLCFVTHSMGGIVVRVALARFRAWQTNHELGRLVMIAPPNRGSRLARHLSSFPPYRWLHGPSGQQLQPSYVRRLPPPSIPFGVIAGGTGGTIGFNPFLEGDNDGTVRVATTRLPEADDFLRVFNLHSLLPLDPRVAEAVVRFLDRGRFTGGE